MTIDGGTHVLEPPFMVIATQNPIDMEGTYALPEAQLDRFLMRISLGHLDSRDEVAVIQGHNAGRTVGNLRPVMDVYTLQQMISATVKVVVTEPLARYAVELTGGTRRHPHVRHGASTRATLALVQAARARALLRGHGHATAADVQALAVPVLAHRLVLTSQAELEGITQQDVVHHVLRTTPVPETAGSRS